PQEEESAQDQNGNHPPKPANPVRHRAGATKLALDEVVVIKLFLRQIQSVHVSYFGPAGLLIGATFRAGFGIGRDVRTAVGTSFRGHSGSSNHQHPSSREDPDVKS